MKQEASGCAPEEKKHGGTAKTQQEAVTYGGQDRASDGSLVAARICLRDDRQKQDRDRVGDGGRKQDQREAHSGQYAVNAKGVCVV